MQITQLLADGKATSAGAICYSGYRKGQNPSLGLFPSYSDILQDLRMLEGNWRFLRIYDAGPHAHTLLEVIKREKLNFKVLLGMDLAAEENNPNCPWHPHYHDYELHENYAHNDKELHRVVRLANEYKDIVLGVSIGNEASVDWTDHKVSTARLVHFAHTLKGQISAPLTFCENYVPWANGSLDELAQIVDMIAVHTYPIWESKPVEEALAFTQQNYASVTSRFPDKPVIITEAGWTTQANGAGFPADFANEEGQTQYCQELLQWSRENQILTFLFEAFDEDWKGSNDPKEPEKHWGIYRLNRQPKPVVSALF